MKKSSYESEKYFEFDPHQVEIYKYNLTSLSKIQTCYCNITPYLI